MGADDPGRGRYNGRMLQTVRPRRFVEQLLGDHQALRQQLDAMAGHAATARSSPAAAAPGLRAVLGRLSSIVRAHEPLEAQLLYPALRRRCPPLSPVIDRMELEHARLDRMLDELQRRLEPTAISDDASGRAGLVRALEQLAAASLGHMAVEESYLLPVAADYLTDDDWNEIEQANCASGS